jgi:hypothetical protein
MKHSLFALFAALPLAFAAWAQEERNSPEEAGTEENIPMENVPEGLSHRVMQGDTLWKLAETYLGDSGQWPVLWATNEQIENPHWIFPGEVVYLRPPPPMLKEAMPPLEAMEYGEPGALITRPADLPSSVAIYTLITPGPIEGWATLESSMQQSEMLSPMDVVHIRVKKENTAQPGETFLILRRGGNIRHPKTGKVLGQLSHVVGAARLHSLEGQRGMASIVRANAEVLRGDMLGPMGESNIRPVYMRKNDKKHAGFVVAVEPTRASMAGGQHLVFVDKGTVDGLAPGNRFHVVRQQDGLGLETVLSPAVVHENVPKQVVGVCTLVDVKSNVSSCLLTWSSREVVPGDRIEMEVE